MAVGLEIENAWIKAVAIGPEGPRARQYALPFRPGTDRSRDVQEGLVAALEQFGSEAGVDPGRCPVAIAASCHFAYPSFAQAHEALVSLVSGYLPQARLAGSDRLYSIAEARSTAGILRFVLARTLGIRSLARACGQAGLVVDCGTTSTEAVWVDPGFVPDPGFIEDPDADSLERLRDGRLTWIGAFETPLDFVTDSAAGWPLVPRTAKMRAVAELCMGVPGSADNAAARRQVAGAVGLDAEILGDDVLAVAHEVHQAAIAKLAAALNRVLSGREAPVDVAVLGLGAEFLARPALASLGIRAAINLEVAAGIPPNFGAALGLALAASADPGTAGRPSAGKAIVP